MLSNNLLCGWVANVGRQVGANWFAGQSPTQLRGPLESNAPPPTEYSHCQTLLLQTYKMGVGPS